jgi:hypothetical protein
VVILVAHEPPLIQVLADAEAAERARAGVRDAYEANGSGAGMAAFIAMTSWRGEFTDEAAGHPYGSSRTTSRASGGQAGILVAGNETAAQGDGYASPMRSVPGTNSRARAFHPGR